MQAVGYCRAQQASTTAAQELAAQRSAIAAEAARRSWSLAAVFDDTADGHSMLGRAGLDRALAAVESRTARALVVTDMTRLSTTFHGVAWLLRSTRRRNWTLVSIEEDIDTAEAATRPLLAVADGLVPVIAYVTFDCARPDALADFWAAATGYRKESTSESAQYAVVSDLASLGPALWFNKVPEPKITKNRVHICLNARAVEDEVERLVALGAEKAEVHSSPSGKTWVVMRDPEGNEFCLVPAARS
jgi:predicted enzyme related to lactoylglutathione lyase